MTIEATSTNQQVDFYFKICISLPVRASSMAQPSCPPKWTNTCSIPNSSRSVYLGGFLKYRYRMKHQQIIKSYSAFTSSNIHCTCIRYLKQIVKCLVYEKRVVMDYAQSRIPNRNFSGLSHKARKNTSNVPIVNQPPSFIKLVSNTYLLRYHHPPFLWNLIQIQIILRSVDIRDSLRLH